MDSPSKIASMMPDAMGIFFHRRHPRPMQVSVMPHVVRGTDVLLCAPTASGKTEAVAAPLFQRHVTFKRKKLSIAWIAPTKALANDIYYRLASYLEPRSPGLVKRYTGDRHEFARAEDAFALVTTPEALDSVQLLKPELLDGLRAVVIDEAHLLHGTARGQQLRHVIRRIRAHCSPVKDPRDRFQQIAMTATLRDSDAVRRIWLGGESVALEFPGSRDIDMTFLKVPREGEGNVAVAEADAVADWLESTGTKKLLIFGNSRNRTHQLAVALHRRLGGTRWPVYLHIGILSAGERENVESAMRLNPFGVCVATSTLEVGIDIGDIDAILLCDPPSSVNSFLQRIGRGNRRSDVCRVVVIDPLDGSAEIFQSLLNCARKGDLDDWHEYDRPSVRFQQLLSLAWHMTRSGGEVSRETLLELAGDPSHDDVINDMISTTHLRQFGKMLVPSDQLMDEGDERRIHSTIAGVGGVAVVDASTGDTVASTSGERGTGNLIFAGSKLREVVAVEEDTIYVSPGGSERGPLAMLPTTRRRGGMSRRIVWAIAEVRGEDPRRWVQNSQRLITWGGFDFNLLLAAVLERAQVARKVNFDEFGVDIRIRLEPASIRDMVIKIREGGGITIRMAKRFCQSTRYFDRLSPEAQAIEAQNAVPFANFLRWIEECSLN
jgi:ATP-dependent helicase Lhr and Lhr-like helicase